MEERELTPWEKYQANNEIGEPRPEVDEEGKPRTARPWDLFNKKIGRVDEEVAEARLAICEECPRLRKKIKQCKECGCFMVEKVKLPNAFCPLGKWQAVEIRH